MAQFLFHEQTIDEMLAEAIVRGLDARQVRRRPCQLRKIMPAFIHAPRASAVSFPQTAAVSAIENRARDNRVADVEFDDLVELRRLLLNVFVVQTMPGN